MLKQVVNLLIPLANTTGNGGDSPDNEGHEQQEEHADDGEEISHAKRGGGRCQEPFSCYGDGIPFANYWQGGQWVPNLQNIAILADLNGELTIDDLDMDVLYDNWAANLSNPTLSDGDLDCDGDIDVNDLDLRFAQYGSGKGS